MKDHEIIAKIGALLDGADAPTRASVEAWLRARLGAPAPAVTLAPALPKPAQPSVVPLPLETICTDGTLRPGGAISVALGTSGPGPRPESDEADGIGTLFIDDTGIKVTGKRIHFGPRPASYG